ncbi:class I SAM-dependent methyltransferase [Chryseolinea lacunae]|uniref:Class I SAM-dependent methyltransferase n=1 Tax=Chryseolinea lacunae TaxID=2801331 RepID=A0ABS1KSM2_9BACT|nr:methyltransferase domain-containing protein [Chryseolinea lacunae]MBL0742456.1 class I SAM-dependent methyltransferase [Chryseolinea lacunae]
MIGLLRKLYHERNRRKTENIRKKNINQYLTQGRVAWTTGYWEYRQDEIKKAIANASWNDVAVKNTGVGLDERIIEFPWIINHLRREASELLDAGSTLNHDYILDHPLLAQKKLSICTYNPEMPSFTERRISYVYDDLRHLPFRDQHFDEAVCISTLEHIDMDNSMYGYDIPNEAQAQVKSYDYLKVVAELNRVLKPGGLLLVTVPYGKHEAHGFFQQMDAEMIGRLADTLQPFGSLELTFFKYLKEGWSRATQQECNDAESYNPHTGKGLKNDGAAHSRAICCIEFTKRP